MDTSNFWFFWMGVAAGLAWIYLFRIITERARQNDYCDERIFENLPDGTYLITDNDREKAIYSSSGCFFVEITNERTKRKGFVLCRNGLPPSRFRMLDGRCFNFTKLPQP